VPLFTVVDRHDNTSFSLRQERTALVAFRSREDAYIVTRALDHRMAESDDEFQLMDLVESPNALDSLKPAPVSAGAPRRLFVYKWRTVEELVLACACNSLNILLCYNIEVSAGLRFQGSVLDVDQDSSGFLVKSLNEKLN